MCRKVRDILLNPDSTLPELKFAREFLKDNRIEALATPGSPLKEAADAADERILRLPTSFNDGSLLDRDDPAIGIG